MTESIKPFILDDIPTVVDRLDFEPYVHALTDIVQTTNTPFSIGVLGNWGAGKTSLMQMMIQNLPKSYFIVWFDAWKFSYDETPVIAFAEVIYRELKAKKLINKWESWLIDPKQRRGKLILPLLGLIVKVLTLGQLDIDTTKLNPASIMSTHLGISIEIQDTFANLIKFSLRKNAKLAKRTNNNNRMVIFIDNLDRCMPDKILQIVEAISLFFSRKDVVCILGVDMEVISKAIESQYLIKFNGSKTEDLVIEGLQYLEKIIQLPFQIPPVSQEDMADFVRGLLSDWAHEECPKVFAEALAGNPRQAKRAVNSFQLAWRLTAYRQEKLGNRITPIRLAKIFAIQAVHPDLYNLLLKEEPRYLRDLEEYCCYESARERGLDYEAITKGFSTRIEPPSALVPFLSRSGANAVRRILTLHEPGFQNANFVGLPVDELRLYFTLTRPTEISKSPPLSEIVRLGFEPQMIRIPAGEFLMGSRFEQPNQTPNNAENSDQAQNEYPQRLVELHEYFIGKYPVTNREYQTFVHDTKYQTPLGWEREQYPPDKGDHPVSNIRWHDANAYCRWLSEKTGKPYHLPTEAEWEKASRGQDGRVYPWGNIFDSNKCNSGELGVNETTPVGQFSPEGDSPYGCADMIGNVWEWCNDWFSEDEYKYRTEKSARNSQGSNKGKNRIIRGGSFIDNHEITRCAYRGVNQPDFSNAWIGFRVALSIGNTKIE